MVEILERVLSKKTELKDLFDAFFLKESWQNETELVLNKVS